MQMSHPPIVTGGVFVSVSIVLMCVGMYLYNKQENVTAGRVRSANCYYDSNAGNKCYVSAVYTVNDISYNVSNSIKSSKRYYLNDIVDVHYDKNNPNSASIDTVPTKIGAIILFVFAVCFMIGGIYILLTMNNS